MNFMGALEKTWNYAVALASSTKQLGQGVKDNDTAVIIDALSSLAAAISGPQQFGHANSI